jgi:16S rRNA G1207 methylase RsmC
LAEYINKFNPSSVADIGCGDGRTTIGIAKVSPSINYFGFDYSVAMISNARSNLALEGVNNVEINQDDIRYTLSDEFDLIYTTRCLINLPGFELQKIALRYIHEILHEGSRYLMIENFIEGQDNFNRLRREFHLPEIPIRDHNYFF